MAGIFAGNHPPHELPWSSELSTKSDWTFQQLAPYIGRMKPSMARALVEMCSAPGDLIADPFAGSGVVPFEAAAAKRRVICADWNPYAVLLTRARLFAPSTYEEALSRFHKTWRLSRRYLGNQDLRRVPAWVRSFFHSGTLRSALALRDACLRRDDVFTLACLLGILHHQRPGFLSYPSSHLVPYLRDNNYPRSRFPALYAERDVECRIAAKIQRMYRRVPQMPLPQCTTFLVDARDFPLPSEPVQAIITSPPYMNGLDYVRDNRLRLWFLLRALPLSIELRSRDRETEYRKLILDVCTRLAPTVKRGGYIVLVVGERTSGRGSGRVSPTGRLTRQVFASHPALAAFRLTAEYQDRIPDIRRSRRGLRGTKAETILMYCKSAASYK